MKKIFREFVGIVAIAIFALSCLNVATADAKVKIKFTNIDPADAASTKIMEQMKAGIEKDTNGEVEVRLFPSGQLGDYTLVYQELTKGTIDMALMPIPTEYEPKHQITLLPGLASSFAEMGKVLSKGSWMFNTVKDLHKKYDVVFLGFQLNGVGGIGSVKPVNQPLDPAVPKNILCRISSMELDKYVTTALGYRTVTIPYSDLYTALQTGVCDGWFGGAAIHSYLGFRDVLKYYYALNLYFESNQFVMAKKCWDKLTPQQRSIVTKYVDKYAKESVKISETEEKEYQAKLKSAGLKVYTYNEKQLAPIQAQLRKEVWPKLNKLIGADLTKQLMKNYKIK